MFKIFNRKIKLPVALLAVLILLIFLHYIKVLTPVENLMIRIIAPVQNRVYMVGVKINNFYNVARFQKDLLKSNLELEQKVKDLTVENAELKIQLSEKQELQKQADFIFSSGFQAVNAKIIGRNLQSNFQTIILNKGKNDAIEIGLPVIAEQGIIIGKIVEVKNSSCQVLLINDSHSSLAALIQDTAIKGVVIGERGLSLKMELIPQDQQIKNGQVVITSGLEENIPKGLVIGQIEQVVSEPNSFFQQAFLKPLINFDDLIAVSVLKSVYND